MTTAKTPSLGTTPGTEQARHQDHDVAGRSPEAGGLADRARDALDDVRERGSDALGAARDWASDAYEAGGRYGRNVGRGGETITSFAQENPLLIGVVGLAAGLLLGAFLPRTRQEDKALGEWSDEVREQGLRYAREVTSRGRSYIEEIGAEDDSDAPTETTAGARRGPSGRYQNH